MNSRWHGFHSDSSHLGRFQMSPRQGLMTFSGMRLATYISAWAFLSGSRSLFWRLNVMRKKGVMACSLLTCTWRWLLKLLMSSKTGGSKCYSHRNWHTSILLLRSSSHYNLWLWTSGYVLQLGSALCLWCMDRNIARLPAENWRSKSHTQYRS